MANIGRTWHAIEIGQVDTDTVSVQQESFDAEMAARLEVELRFSD